MAKGFAPWKPTKQTRKYLDEVVEVMSAHQADWPMTQRYWLYKLMAEKGWLKVDEYKPSNYKPEVRHLCTPNKNLNQILDRGRRAGLIPWDAVVSKRGELKEPLNEASASELADYIEFHIESTQFDRQKGQPRWVVLWCETEGMVKPLWSVARHYGANLLAGQGFDSIGSKHNFAGTIADMGDVLILHIGDLDKSGHTVFKSLVEDLNAYIRELGGRMTLKRIGLTEEQVYEYGLEYAATPATTGLNAGNHGDGFNSKVECQLEAMNTEDVRAIVTAEFEMELDMDIFRDRLENEKAEKLEAAKLLTERLGGNSQ